jgi:hypothetical protein
MLSVIYMSMNLATLLMRINYDPHWPVYKAHGNNGGGM